jgi:hypothetical protein
MTPRLEREWVYAILSPVRSRDIVRHVNSVRQFFWMLNGNQLIVRALSWFAGALLTSSYARWKPVVFAGLVIGLGSMCFAGAIAHLFLVKEKAVKLHPNVWVNGSLEARLVLVCIFASRTNSAKEKAVMIICTSYLPHFCKLKFRSVR